MFTLQAKDADVNGNASGFIGQYAHGNEPSHHVAYLYNYSGQPWKSQFYTHKILTELYDNTVTGLSGNEDCGQMSAWYVFAAMGFYPVNPASGEYQLCSPLFDRITIHLDKNKKFEINCRRTNGQAKLIRGAFLNGKPVTTNTIRHADIRNGGLLDIALY